MPNRPPHPCNVVGCGALTTQRFCRTHQAAAEAQARAADQERGSAASRGYGPYWQRLRLVVLAREPLCRECAKEGRSEPATHVDHIIALERGGTNAIENLQPLCRKHHGQKTANVDTPSWRRRGPRG